MRNLFNTLFAVAAIAITISSCKKDNQTASPSDKLSLSKEVATVTPVTSDTIYGHWANPRGGNFGSIYVNLTSATLDTASTTNPRFDIVLNNFNNSFVQGVNGYTVEYINDPLVNFSTIGTTTTGITQLSIGQSTTGAGPTPSANGWYTYAPPGGITLVPDFYIIARSNTPSKPSYALKFTYAIGQGTATLNRGKYIIQYGPIL
ncbi:hypothetical protein J7E50_02820 [Pedobacter sp. ISL-68]|uniref:hypothetical protein n=1 Tax=unclassified Pedobacter TaxID=2628915 RepID=UPI001BED3582|nr:MULTISPECIES: hypothetical protein [unclassified Pedobacter]MBT2560153.1 hypothetical protein [Pedobacter sp. ISL-64]MBT2589132.1 hypothetical protein [Pedobacter sp. ISL-68]